MIFRIVGAGLRRRHPVAFPAIERDVDLQRLGQKRAWPQLIENVLRVEGTVVAADAGMVATDDKMRAAEILANEGMQQRLARTGIAHLDGIARLNHRSRPEIIVDHRLDRARSHLGRDVAFLQLAEHLMDEDAVHDLHRDFHQILVTAVHRISGLEGGDCRPAPFKKHCPRLRQAGYRAQDI